VAEVIIQSIAAIWGKPAVQQKTTDDDQIGSEKARTGKDRLVEQHDEVDQAE